MLMITALHPMPPEGFDARDGFHILIAPQLAE
jgi:hypothetical protein